MDQGCVVRLESRAREFTVVARLTALRREPQGNQVSAVRKDQGECVKALKSLTSDPNPGDLLLSKVKSPFRGMEA